jgi:hypothetical protein
LTRFSAHAGKKRIERIQRQQILLAQQDLPCVRARNDLAQGLAEKLGSGEILLSGMPQK